MSLHDPGRPCCETAPVGIGLVLQWAFVPADIAYMMTERGFTGSVYSSDTVDRLLEQRIMMNSLDLTSRTPVTLVTGFLGSGKSTLLNRLIQTFHGTRFGIIVNEFGEIPLENEIIQAQDGDIIEFSNGCLCCVARNDLMRAVKSLRRSRVDLDHILVEASGLSDPVPVAQSFLRGPGRRSFEFGAMVCVVDAERLEDLAASHSIVTTQLEFCDFVYLTRLDGIAAEYRHKLEGFLAASAPKARILTDEGDRELETLFAVGGIDVAARGFMSPSSGVEGGSAGRAAHEASRETPHESVYREGVHRDHVHPDHGTDGIESLMFESSVPVDEGAFRELLAALPPGILRAKGVLYFAGSRSRRYSYLLQIAGGRRALDARRRRRGEPTETRLLFLGRDFDVEELRRRLQGCVVGERVR